MAVFHYACRMDIDALGSISIMSKSSQTHRFGSSTEITKCVLGRKAFAVHLDHLGDRNTPHLSCSNEATSISPAHQMPVRGRRERIIAHNLFKV